MANRQLTAAELEVVRPLLDRIRAEIDELATGDPELQFAIRRKIYKEMTYDERGKPMHRKMLKAKKWMQQKGKCAICEGELPEKYAVLDRLEAIGGYSVENTRLICTSCDSAHQESKGYR